MKQRTTPFIETLNTGIDNGDGSTVHNLIVGQLLTHPNYFTPLDWMAAGRASIAHKNEFYQAWTQIEMHRFIGRKPEIAPENLQAWRIGCIAARIERNDLVHIRLRERGDCGETDLSTQFLGAALAISNYHPSPDVRDIADWSVRILEEQVAQKMGLTPLS